jgi:hypothetical protein
VIAVAVCLVIGGQAQSPQDAPKQASLQPLLQVLNKAGLSASLEFSGSCNSLDVSEFPDFPVLRQPTDTQRSPLDTVRAMFASNPDMSVTQDIDGTIRIVQHNVESDLLSLRIERISLESLYDPNLALMHVLVAPEVRLFYECG